MREKISIIIPCYNVQKSVRKCLNSVIHQTYKNIEIIVINDGSTDKTNEIIKTFLNDDRIKYYNRTNHGIGKTRNFGIKEASGKYITFLDSDDYLDKKAIELLYNKVKDEDLDLVVSDFYIVSNNLKYEKINNFSTTSIKDNPNLILDINLAPWNKLYKANLIKNIKFEEQLKYEDAPFVIGAMLKAKKIGKLNNPTHYYIVNENSETTIRDDRIFDIFEILDIISEMIKDKTYLSQIYKQLVIRIICNYNIQQRYQKSINLSNQFIDKGFNYMKMIDSNYKNNPYFKTRSRLKRIIEKNKILTKIYCDVYIFLH